MARTVPRAGLPPRQHFRRVCEVGMDRHLECLLTPRGR
jgi:hypothetical protein